MSQISFKEKKKKLINIQSNISKWTYEFQIKFRAITKLTNTISSISLNSHSICHRLQNTRATTRPASETCAETEEKEREQNPCKLAQLISESTIKKGRSISNYESNPGRLAELGGVSPQNSSSLLHASRSHPSRLKRCNAFSSQQERFLPILRPSLPTVVILARRGNTFLDRKLIKFSNSHKSTSFFDPQASCTWTPRRTIKATNFNAFQ